MKSRIFPAALLLRAIAIAGVIGFAAAPASVAFAQASPGAKSKSSAAAAKSGDVAGVVVQAPPKVKGISPEKRAALDAEASKRKAWQKYRSTTPTATARTTTGASAASRAENYPGVRSLGAH